MYLKLNIKQILLFFAIVITVLACDINEKKSIKKIEKTDSNNELSKTIQDLDLKLITSFIGEQKNTLIKVVGKPLFETEKNDRIEVMMKEGYSYIYDKTTEIINEMYFTFNTEAGSFKGKVPKKFSPDLDASKTIALHGEPDQTLQNKYFYILDYSKTKKIKFVFESAKSKLFRLYFFK
jgi:hypothetical protein